MTGHVLFFCYKKKKSTMHACLFSLVIMAVVVESAVDCSTFNHTNIDLVTFDVFAALMDTQTSLLQTFNSLFPGSPSANAFISKWITLYADQAGRQFTR